MSLATPSVAARTVRLALAMAAADQRCAFPWHERVRLTKVLAEDAPLAPADWQRWGWLVLTWLVETRPTLTRQVEDAVARWKQEEALWQTSRP